MPSPRALKLLPTCLVALCAVLAASSPTQAADPARAIADLLRKLPDSRVTCGAEIVDLDTKRTVYALNADTPLVPASNQKLLVMAAAIDRLADQPEPFRTVLAIRGNDLVLFAAGDPCLGDEQVCAAHGLDRFAFLDLWAHALRSSGRDNLAGRFIVDTAIFDDRYVHPDWDPADLVKWYGAPVGGLNLNNNCVEITAWPAAAGASADWAMFPPASTATVVNNCRSAPGTSATPTVGRRPGTFELVLSGSVGKRVTLQPIAVYEPSTFAAAAIRQRLTEQGVRVAGDTLIIRSLADHGELATGVEIIGQHVTPLADVLGRVGINSQNMCAEALLKRLGHEHADRQAPGSWENGKQGLAAFLDRIGCDTRGMVIADGSGLSRENRITAGQFIDVLRFMHRHPRRELFIASLAGNHTGGTLKKRMDDIPADVHAKTGYMRGVRTLSGYVHTTGGKWYAFSILFNGFNGSSAAYNRLHHDVCDILARTGEGAKP